MKRTTILSVIVSAIILASGCNNESVDTTQIQEFQKSLQFVILEDEAVDFATDFLNKESNSRSQTDVEVETIWRNIKLNSSSSRSANDIELVEVPVYVVSYVDKNGTSDGYVVTVGDKRVINRVLVYSENGEWDLSGIPEFEAFFWDNVDNSLIQTLSDSEIDMCDTYEYEEVGEIEEYAVTSFLTWGQSPSPYNDSVPACSSTTNMLAGCAAVAMGQIMAKHEYPLTGSYVHQEYNRTVNAVYDWSAMKASNSAIDLSGENGRSGVANILAEAGYKLNMNYGCTGSSAYPADVPSAFNQMGYSCSNKRSFNLSLVLNDIDEKRPVFIYGYSSLGGHAWIVEGYKQIVNNLIYGRDCPYGGGEEIPPTVIETDVVSDYLYFNLGWHGSSNGFYYADTFSTWEFGTSPGIVYNIIPQE